MIELPEAAVLAGQIDKYLSGKIFKKVTVNHSPHKFAWYSEDPDSYNKHLTGKEVRGAVSRGGQVEMNTGEFRLLFSDGVNLIYHSDESSLPKKHQLLAEFRDGTFLSASVQMYGGLVLFKPGVYENEYYQAALEAPSPLTDSFSPEHFNKITGAQGLEKKSVKEVLATKQRIPGLGNGVLHDILFKAGIHHKRKMNTLSEKELSGLYESIRNVLREMTGKGGRNTETDLLGKPGGYEVKMCKNNLGNPCPVCGGTVAKAAFMGGSIYYCPECQQA